MTTRLSIDWIRCEARGLCVELLPEVLTADDWGYPLASSTPPLTVPQAVREHAEAAVRECPRLALRLVTERTETR
jgi:ferredoxin